MNLRDLNIIFIGAGNLAANLAKALHGKGYHISQVYSRTELSAKTLATMISADYTTVPEDIINSADLYIVSLKDSAFEELLPKITVGKQQALMVHTAGSIPIDIFKNAMPRYGVLYPMQTFSKQREVCFDSIPFFVEANNTTDLELLKELAQTLSNKVYEASSEQRRYLHLSAVFACNFTNHMYALCEVLLKKHNLPFEVMLPLIDETARKVHELSPEQAQTGPAIRYDENVINKHLDLLADNPEMQQLYELISKSIHELQ